MSEVDKDWGKDWSHEKPVLQPSIPSFTCVRRLSMDHQKLHLEREWSDRITNSDCMCLFYWNVPCVQVQQRWGCAALPSFISVIASVAAGEQLRSQPEPCPDFKPAVSLRDTPNHTDCGQHRSHSRGSHLVKPLCETAQQLTAHSCRCRCRCRSRSWLLQSRQPDKSAAPALH